VAGARDVLDGIDDLVRLEPGDHKRRGRSRGGRRGRTLHDLPYAPRPCEDAEAPPRLLAPSDSLLLAHQDRTRLVSDERKPALVTKILRIPATFLIDGMVAGTWTQIRGKLELQPFGKLSARHRRALEEEVERLPR
jgi:DNA glycosylase AlkZ-like